MIDEDCVEASADKENVDLAPSLPFLPVAPAYSPTLILLAQLPFHRVLAASALTRILLLSRRASQSFVTWSNSRIFPAKTLVVRSQPQFVPRSLRR
jgi:hypothetical protein